MLVVLQPGINCLTPNKLRQTGRLSTYVRKELDEDLCRSEPILSEA